MFFFFKLQGTYGFEVQIDRYMELAKYFYKVLKKKDNFKLVFDAEVRTLLVGFFWWYFNVSILSLLSIFS